MKTADELFNKAMELAYEEVIKEVSENLTINSFLGCVSVTSECDYDIPNMVIPVVELLQKDWSNTRPRNEKSIKQVAEINGYWIDILDQLEQFIKKTRKQLVSH